MNNYIDFQVTPYCLAKLFLALESSNIKIYTITQEDNELHVRIPRKHLEEIVYPKEKSKNLCECSKESN